VLLWIFTENALQYILLPYGIIPIMNKLIERIIQFRDARDWKQFHLPKNLAISLLLEASEVLELFQWTKDGHLPPERKNDLKEELADVYYWVLLLAHECNIDLDKALEEKMEQNETKYPVEKAKGNAIKYNRRKS
jgi:NTP pyrophosphatase (non-canonical NTP hydrolase)